MPKFDRDLLAHKVQWEGGVLAALDYGLTADDIDDPVLAKVWREAEEEYAPLRATIKEVDRLLRERVERDPTDEAGA